MVADERNMLDHILSRENAYKALIEWIPNARSQYASNRNYDIEKNTTSRLSSFISSGLLSEEVIIQCANNIGIPSKNNKFLEEIFWRIYFRGYLENRPSIWKSYISDLKKLDNHKFKLKDLKSRLKTFYHVSIYNPDDEMIKIILTKLLIEKQFIIKNPEIFEFLVHRIERSYQSIYNLVDKLDKLSLEKKRQLTIPLIKEIL